MIYFERRFGLLKRIISLFLCLIMVVAAFSACNELPDEESQDTTTDQGNEMVTTPPPVEEEAIPDNIELIASSECTVIRPAMPSSYLMTELVGIVTNINTLTAGVVGFNGDSLKGAEQENEPLYEIIVGETVRTQSVAAKSVVKQNTFVIQRSGNKIIIVGSNDVLSIEGFNYFVNNYVKPYSGEGKIALPKEINYVSGEYSNIDIVKDGHCYYKVIFSDDLDITANSNNGKIDYVAQKAKDVKTQIASLSDVGVTLKTDWVRPGYDTSYSKEILIGAVNREEYQTALSKYKPNEYGISVVNNKIVVAGWSDTTIGLAADMFMKLLAAGVSTDSAGKKEIKFAVTSDITGCVDSWQVDIPAVDGATFTGSSSCNHNDMLYYYTDAMPAEYDAYLKKLESEGYKLYMKNEMTGNEFATYISADGKVMLHAYYVKYEKAIRIVTGSNVDEQSLPETVGGAPQYTKITESKVTQMTLDYASSAFGMCYIVTLEDGSFIIFDGGSRQGVTDHVRLYNLLNKLNERPDGKIVIAAWILTHSHQDHYMVFYNFCKAYGSKVTIEQHISNVPDTVVRYNSGNPGGHMEDGTFDEARRAAGNFKLVKPYTGMEFWVRNAEIDVLYTYEAYYPQKLSIFNNSTMVLRMKIGGQTIMWLGDVQYEGSDVICDMYGAYIKSDIVQVAHHGGTGATKELYSLVDPSIAFWPSSASQFINQTAGTSTNKSYIIDYYLAKQMNVVDIFVAQPDNISITLPHTPGSGAQRVINVPAG